MGARLGRRLLTGMAAGLVGTVAMDLLWYGRYRRGGGEGGIVDWEFASGTASFAEASAPGQVGRIVADALGVDLPEASAATTTNVVHWLTGAGYGLAHGLLLDRPGVAAAGVATGLGAVANSYATLGALGVYEPPWAYDAATLRDDVSAHLVFGLATSLAYRLLRGQGRGGSRR
ncbi:MAG: hypothetical protein R6T85_12025 [Egibacteraceae bacterium]